MSRTSALLRLGLTLLVAATADAQVPVVEATVESARTQPPLHAATEPSPPNASPDATGASPSTGAPHLDQATQAPTRPQPHLRARTSEGTTPATRRLATRVGAVVAARRSTSAPAEDPDALYDETFEELRRTQRELGRSLIGWDAGIEQTFADFEALRALRTQLIPQLSPERRERVTGRNLFGFRELLGEFQAIALHLSFEAGAIPQALPRLLDQWVSDPVRLLWKTGLVILSLLVFRRWRSWAPKGIPSVRERFLRAYPRRPYHVRVARVLWYTQEIRSPLEWLVLLGVLFRLLDAPELRALAEPLWMVASWVLVARAAIRGINAFGRRGAWQIGKDRMPLRLRSLRLVAAWIVLLGLGLDVSQYFSGQSTLYAWTWSLFQLLTAPIAILLLYWWRGPIFDWLEEEAEELTRARTLLTRRSSWRSLPAALEALVLLVAHSAWESLTRTALRVDEARAVASLVLGREIRSGGLDDDRAGTEPIPDELTRDLLEIEGAEIDAVGRKEVDRLVELAGSSRLSAIMITSARGGGKTHVLARMADRLGDRMIVVPCLPGGIAPLRAAIAQQLELRLAWSAEELDARIVERQIEAIGVDDLHRLVRPVMGGQEGLLEFGEIVRSLQTQVLWCGTADRRTWEFIRAGWSEIARVQDVIELGAWSETEIGNLIDRRLRKLELDPDFSGLELPPEVGEVGHATEEDQTRWGFYRLLWQASEGNPGIALRYLANSLRMRPDGTLVVRRPALPTADDLDRVSLSLLLLLRALVRHAHSSAEDLAAALRISEAETGNMIVAARNAGWIEELDGRYRVTWTWLPAVLRILVRKNLQPR